MDFSEFDALPLRDEHVIVLDEPYHGGIRDMPRLEDVSRIVGGCLNETGWSAMKVADRACVPDTVVKNMAGGHPVPLAEAMRVFDVVGVKPVRVPAEYLEA
ncbi:hypothetical protein BW13_08520 [Bifidobacterium sp. UTCIF-37]|uniref:hypothetical protein n=1 Tax=unclassified Bifidobacterium TaxID=2608897 RepID=UPI00112DB910|nr:MULTISPECIES: hypothetical protein [unclassified Bifidobacterium]TPF85857.1 hypothetical protein BW13_08520 [Bifidobacterium sp. UTCIF-37]TPF87790.1 hypothetical protein BW11_09795 [Bifidobacterium sp. UTCIF-38]